MGAAVELVREAVAQAERFDVIVIGGGQAGLSVGYYLARQGLRFVILDAEERIGDVWRKRWDSLRLFTPARFDALVGMPFPTPPDSFPTHTEMADYLEAYAARFQLPVQSRMRVESLCRRDGRYVVVAGGRFAASVFFFAAGAFLAAAFGSGFFLGGCFFFAFIRRSQASAAATDRPRTR